MSPGIPLNSRNLSSGLAARAVKNLNFIKASEGTADVHVVTQVISSLLSILVFPIEKGAIRSSSEEGYFDPLKQVVWTNDTDARAKLVALFSVPSLRIYQFQQCDNLHQFYKRIRNAISHRHIEFTGDPDSRDLCSVIIELKDGPSPPKDHSGKLVRPFWKAGILN